MYLWSNYECLQRYRLLENSNTEILLFEDVLEFDLCPPPPPISQHGPYWVPMVQVECFLIIGCKDIEILLFEDVLDFDL